MYPSPDSDRTLFNTRTDPAFEIPQRVGEPVRALSVTVVEDTGRSTVDLIKRCDVRRHTGPPSILQLGVSKSGVYLYILSGIKEVVGPLTIFNNDGHTFSIQQCHSEKTIIYSVWWTVYEDTLKPVTICRPKIRLFINFRFSSKIYIISI